MDIEVEVEVEVEALWFVISVAGLWVKVVVTCGSKEWEVVSLDVMAEVLKAVEDGKSGYLDIVSWGFGSRARLARLHTLC